MNHKERFKNSLLLKEVDKLAHGEQMIHDFLVAKILKQDLEGDNGNALAKWMCEPLSNENFIRHKKVREFLGFDYVQVFPMEPVTEIGTTKSGHTKVKDIWGAEQEITQESSHIIKKPINGLEEMKRYQFPDINKFSFSNVTNWINDGEYFVASQIDTGFFKVTQLVGFEDYMDYIYFNKTEIHELMEKFTNFQIKLADHLIDLGVDCIWLSDDHAFNSGSFISPDMMNEFDFKYMKKIVEHVHSRGVPVTLHSCGNLNGTIEKIIDTGVNGLHAIQPSAFNDIYSYKKKYGKDLCFLGNMDINYLIPSGSPYEIDLKVKEMVENMFYDRTGFILTTANLLNMDVPVENAITMHLAAEKYGR